jgi:hypothetical protein
MQLVYNLFNEKVSLNTNEKAIYLPLGKAYFVFSQNKSSKYFGLNFWDKKFLDFNFSFPEIKKIELKENSFIINDQIKLIFENNKLKINKPIKIFLDTRYLYDFNPFNRKIEVLRVNDNKYTIKTNLRDLSFNGNLKLKKEWKPFNFSLDERRKDGKEWWLFYLGDFKGIIEFPFEFKNKKEEYSKKENLINEILKKATNKYLKLSFKLAFRNLMDKEVGRPWFFQDWKRDYLISLNAFYYLDEISFIKEKIFYYVSLLKRYMKNNKLFHIDELGLLIKKIKDFWFLFNEEEKEYLIKNLLLLHYTAPIYNEKGETWMDSINREGFSIEVQALFYEGFSLLEKYDKEFSYLKKKIEETVKHIIFHGYILDGLERFEIRPNFILAYYFSPELAKKLEFDKYFDKSFNQLWLEWGGVSSLSTCNPLFYEEHTGIDSKSYHSGDSWYFLNNITGIILIDKYLKEKNKKRKKDLEEKIIRLLDSALRDILLLFIPSGHSEISSAKKQESFGCFDQLWSNATFIEFVIKYLNYFS